MESQVKSSKIAIPRQIIFSNTDLLATLNLHSLVMSKKDQSEMIQPGPSSDHIERTGRYVEGEDPHQAALEDNPDHAERLSWSTCAAIFVS